MSEEAMVSEGVTTPFLPHGLGHPLGLQVHDAAGFMQNDQGEHLAAPAMYPFLRCTRILEPRMVLTIERDCILLSLCWHHGVKVSSASTLTGNVLSSLNLVAVSVLRITLLSMTTVWKI